MRRAAVIFTYTARPTKLVLKGDAKSQAPCFYISQKGAKYITR